MIKTGNEFVLVTGGSSGIGLAIAHAFAKRGFNLLLVSNQEEQLQICAAELAKQYHIKCLVIFADLSEPGAAQQVFEYCRLHSLEIIGLVNNAGILVFSELSETPAVKIKAILNLHIHTPVMLCRLFGEVFKAQKKGYILNVSSISSVMPYPAISLYGPTKTFIRYFSRALRYEMKPYHVSVTCLLPGATQTALYDPNQVNMELAKKLRVMHEANFVAEKGVMALLNDRAECIPGFLNKLTVFFLPFVPAFIIHWMYKYTDWIKSGKNKLG